MSIYLCIYLLFFHLYLSVHSAICLSVRPSVSISMWLSVDRPIQSLIKWIHEAHSEHKLTTILDDEQQSKQWRKRLLLSQNHILKIVFSKHAETVPSRTWEQQLFRSRLAQLKATTLKNKIKILVSVLKPTSVCLSDYLSIYYRRLLRTWHERETIFKSPVVKEGGEYI